TYAFAIGRLVHVIMDTANAESFNWGPLGEAWWRAAGETVGATELQTKFACSRHQGSSATAAARAAGYARSPGRIRELASRTAKTEPVRELLALAAAEGKPGGQAPVDGDEARAILSEMIRGNDPGLRIRSIEALMRLSERQAELGKPLDDDGFG